MSQYKIITTKKEVLKLIKFCKATKYASVDFETSGLEYYSKNEYPLMLGVSFQPGSAWILPLQHKDSPLKDKWLKLFNLFCKKVIEDKDIVKVAWNLKFEYKWFLRYGHVMRGYLFDGMLAKYCLDEEKPNDLKSFVDWVFPKYSGYENSVKGNKWADKPLDKLAPYCAIDCDLELRAAIMLEPRLIKLGFYNVFRNLLMPMTRVLGESEFRGIRVHREYLKNLVEEYRVKIAKVQKELRALPSIHRFERKYAKVIRNKAIDAVQAEIRELQRKKEGNWELLIQNRENKIARITEGKILTKKEKYDGINFASPPQMIQFLYTKRGLNLPILKYTKDKNTKKPTTTPSTDEETLLKLQKKDKSGFIKGLLEFRGLTKLDSTYISGIYPRLDHNDIIHASFKIHGTVTGRLSCEDPNLQNIPRDTTAKDIKTMFIPPVGYGLLEVDYSQAELRIIAELSEDAAMIDIFKKNYNIHVATACKMNGGLHLYDKVKGILKDNQHKDWLFWEKEKKKGKSLNFSIVYQQGPEATAETLECSVDDAKKFQKEWFKQFPMVQKYINKIKSNVKRDEYVISIFGRKRRLPDANSPLQGFRSKAERDAVNAPVQGASGDFTSLSEIVIRHEILSGNLPSDMFQAYTVHDSIGFYIQPKDLIKTVPKIIKICDNPDTMKYFGFNLKHVTMKVSPEFSMKSWADLEEYDPFKNYLKST